MRKPIKPSASFMPSEKPPARFLLVSTAETAVQKGGKHYVQTCSFYKRQLLEEPFL